MLGEIFAVPNNLLSVGGSLTPTVFAAVGMSSLAVTLIGGSRTMTFLVLEINADFPFVVLVLTSVISSSVLVLTTFGYSLAT